MRGLSVCLLLTGLSQAAQVYLNPPIPSSSKVTPNHAGLALSHHLGLEDFESVGDNGELFGGLLNEQPFVGKGSSNGLLLTVDEAEAKDVIPSNFQPSFSVSNSALISSLVPNYLDRARHAFSSIYSTASHPTYPRSHPRVLDIFSVSSSQTEEFIQQVSAISDFLETKNPVERFGAFELTGLHQIAHAYGRQSEEYKLAAQTTRALLQSAMSNANLHLALLTTPLPSHVDKRQSVQPPDQSPFPSPVPKQPISGSSTCFASAEACGNSTSACSGRGECVAASKAGRTCFVCACAQTKSTKGKTETWVGESCERKDISGPFVLIVGTVIALIVTIAGSVSLLYSIGDDQLPSTLTGGAAGAKRD